MGEGFLRHNEVVRIKFDITRSQALICHEMIAWSQQNASWTFYILICEIWVSTKKADIVDFLQMVVNSNPVFPTKWCGLNGAPQFIAIPVKRVFISPLPFTFLPLYVPLLLLWMFYSFFCLSPSLSSCFCYFFQLQVTIQYFSFLLISVLSSFAYYYLPTLSFQISE